jgi:hypothetical protein
VSVASLVEAGYEQRWCLMNERGRVPEGYSSEKDGVELAHPYVVVVLVSAPAPSFYRRAAVGELTEQLLQRAMQRVVPGLVRVAGGGFSYFGFDLFEKGFFSGDESCGCRWNGMQTDEAVCRGCAGVPRHLMSFVLADRFERVDSYREHQRFTGVTEAIDIVSNGYGFDTWLCLTRQVGSADGGAQ